MPLKVSELLKIIEADGWYLVSTKGSHRQYKHPSKGGRVTVPGKAQQGVAHRHGTKHPEADWDEPEARMITYAIIIERAEDGGYGAWCPDLPGCIALGDTPAEAITEMKDAIEFHLDGLREDGLPIPHPSTVAATIVTTDAA
ncbi:MAG: type II toxin-antitoxin system HicB family antitoxin [Pseudonocardiales bacterium]